MKNESQWFPTKYEIRSGKLRASRNSKYVSIGSRLMADLVAVFYEKYIPQYVHGTLCDLGCGYAPLYLLYKDYANDVVLCDWKNSLHKNAHIDFECDLNQPLPFDDCSFDTIILSDVLEHIYEPNLLLGEISRCLRSNGVLMLNVPFYYWLHEEPHDYYRYTYYALQRLVNTCGLELRYFDGIGGAREVVADILSKRMLAGKTSKLRTIIADRLQHYCAKHANTSLSKRQFPIGYFLVAVKTQESENII
jgi:SAM-dependent methyltransferase